MGVPPLSGRHRLYIAKDIELQEQHHMNIYQAIAAADGGLQMQKQSAERMGEARQWLATALDRDTVAQITTTELDTTPLSSICMRIWICVKNARDLCAGWRQRRGEDVPESSNR